jgi:hypothetical protein
MAEDVAIASGCAVAAGDAPGARSGGPTSAGHCDADVRDGAPAADQIGPISGGAVAVAGGSDVAVSVGLGGVQAIWAPPSLLPDPKGTATPTRTASPIVRAITISVVGRSPFRTRELLSSRCQRDYFGMDARPPSAGLPAIPNAASSVPGLVIPKFRFHRNIGPTQPQFFAC